jgi:integrase
MVGIGLARFRQLADGDEIDTNTIRAQQWEKGISCPVLVFRHQLQRLGQEFHPGKCSGLLAVIDEPFVAILQHLDIGFEDIDENFGEEYKLFLKRDQGRIDSYVNHCLLWLNMLMYKAVDRSIIRFNPIAKVGYEKKAAPKMTHISKADFIKMLSTPMADERTELARRCFIFASLTSLSYIDVKKLYPHHISENSEGRKFIRKEREKTGVEFFVPLHPIAEKILSLYNTTDDSKPVFPLGEKKDIYLDVHTLGMVLGISNKLGFHASRHTFGVLMLIVVVLII